MDKICITAKIVGVRVERERGERGMAGEVIWHFNNTPLHQTTLSLDPPPNTTLCGVVLQYSFHTYTTVEPCCILVLRRPAA